MPSIKTILLATALLFSSAVSSQRDYNIDTESIPLAIKEGWCGKQKAACPLLCTQANKGSQSTAANDCDDNTLAFNCICANGISPNASEFSETIPFFKCRQYGEYCVLNCGGNSQCQFNCRADNPCGAQNPTRVNLTSSTSSAAASATKNPTGVAFNGFAGQTPAADASGSNGGGKQSAGVMAMDIGRSYGLAVVLTGFFAGFALVL